MRHAALKFAAISVFVLSLSASTLVRAESVGQYIDDATITTKVKAALVADKQLKAKQVSVETTQARGQLTGTVDNKTQEAEALKVANQVKGVRSVKDLLKVRTTVDQ